MHIDTSPKERPTGSANNPAGHTDSLIVASGAVAAKNFANLAARFALTGHTLHQPGPNDSPGPVSYVAERWGMARHLPTLAAAEQFLIQVEGAGHAL